jgi:hypothetical protein
MVVVIDDDLLSHASDGGHDEVSLLAGLLGHPYFVLYRYADEGPPGDAPRRHLEHFGEYVPGWIAVGARRAEDDVQPVSVGRETGVLQGGIFGNATNVAGGDSEASAYGDLPEEEARARRERDAIAVQACGVADADLFITRREYLQVVSWDLARGIVVVSPEDALPLIGLYLRSQREYLVSRSLDGRWTSRLDDGLFFWVGTRELLPAGWRWFSGLVVAGADDERLVYLGQSAFQRVQRALRSRDDALRALQQEPNNNTAEEALASLEVILLELMGALDVAARVAHLALGIDGSPYRAAWHRRWSWREAVEAACPELGALVAQGTDNAALLRILSALRNSVHGAALDTLGVSEGLRRTDRYLVGLPHDDAVTILEAMDQLGGRDSWGVEELVPDRFHLDPGDLIDRMLVESIALLDALMQATPVDRIQGVAPEDVDVGPPNDAPFDEITRRSVRLQLGL